MLTRRRLLAASSLIASVPWIRATSARTSWPSRAITLVVPFPAGGTTDLLARVFGQKIGDYLGQAVIIENRGGAGGSIGAEAVARAAPDGHTLLFHNLTFSTTTVALELAGRSKHLIEKDFVPVALAANVPMLVVAAADVAAKDLAAFVGIAKAADPPLFYGSTGQGSVMHLAVEVLKRDAGIKLEHIAYRGAAPLIQELLAGRIALGGDQLSTSLEFVRSGKLKPMATLAAERIGLLPDVPTVAELGFSNMELRGWNGVFAPAGTPAVVVGRINAAINAAVADVGISKRLADIGAEVVGGTPADLAAIVNAQIVKVRPLVADLKIVL